MKIKNKYATGTQIMFYEIEMCEDNISGIINTLKLVEKTLHIISHLICPKHSN